jgi:hypothetical protein
MLFSHKNIAKSGNLTNPIPTKFQIETERNIVTFLTDIYRAVYSNISDIFRWPPTSVVEKRLRLFRFVVLTAMAVFGVITPCSPGTTRQCFGGIWRHHLQDRRVSQRRNKHDAVKNRRNSASHVLHSGLFRKTEEVCSSETSFDFHRI